MIADAQTNGGSLSSAHKEFRNGYLFAVLDAGDYVPVVFGVEDIFGCMSNVIVASGDVFHKTLMRSDGGWVVTDDSVTPTFDFRELQKLVYGFTQGPDGELYERYGYGLLDGKGFAIEGFDINRVSAKRCDRTFWDPGYTVQNETGQKELFSFAHIDPRSCMDNDGCDDCSDDSWLARTGEVVDQNKHNTEDL